MAETNVAELAPDGVPEVGCSQSVPLLQFRQQPIGLPYGGAVVSSDRSPLTGEDSKLFDELMAEVMSQAPRFGHRQHVHLTWLAVRRCGVAHATALVSAGIQRTARYAGAPQKYHATVSRAWVLLVEHHFSERGETDFDAFAEHNAALMDKRLLTRFYRSTTLASAAAKTGWVEPDQAPFPWLERDPPPQPQL